LFFRSGGAEAGGKRYVSHTPEEQRKGGTSDAITLVLIGLKSNIDILFTLREKKTFRNIHPDSFSVYVKIYTYCT
jgi:hypothetical protein